MTNEEMIRMPPSDIRWLHVVRVRRVNLGVSMNAPTSQQGFRILICIVPNKQWQADMKELQEGAYVQAYGLLGQWSATNQIMQLLEGMGLCLNKFVCFAILTPFNTVAAQDSTRFVDCEHGELRRGVPVSGVQGEVYARVC